jgi:hypothetical protein
LLATSAASSGGRRVAIGVHGGRRRRPAGRDVTTFGFRTWCIPRCRASVPARQNSRRLSPDAPGNETGRQAACRRGPCGCSLARASTWLRTHSFAICEASHRFNATYIKKISSSPPTQFQIPVRSICTANRVTCELWGFYFYFCLGFVLSTVM